MSFDILERKREREEERTCEKLVRFDLHTKQRILEWFGLGSVVAALRVEIWIIEKRARTNTREMKERASTKAPLDFLDVWTYLKCELKILKFSLGRSQRCLVLSMLLLYVVQHLGERKQRMVKNHAKQMSREIKVDIVSISCSSRLRSFFGFDMHNLFNFFLYMCDMFLAASAALQFGNMTK